MIKHTYLFLFVGFIFSCSENSSEIETENDLAAEEVYAGNPIITDMFTADPAALVHNDTLYVFTGHDEQQEGEQGFIMNEWLVFSTTDMVNWTYHGAPLSIDDFDWAKGDAWAAHVEKKDGKFYWYITAEHATIPGKAIGVAVADHPLGPWEDALGKALITNEMTDHVDIPWDDIDPAVFVDEDGSAHLYWGNTVLKYAPLKENMIELAGEIQTVDLPEFTEGPYVFKRDSLYYLTYSAQFPEVIDYAIASDPAGPWQKKGLLNEVIHNSPTNHQAVIEYKGNWYFIYHNAALPGGGEFRRSVAVDYLYFNEDGTLKQIQQTRSGVRKITD